jgi:hypothetical protein
LKLNRIKTWFQNLLYLFSLYFKRGAWSSLFYFFTVFLILVIVGFLLESNAKMDRVVQEMNKIIPPNRIKVNIPSNIKIKRTGGGILSLLGQKEEKVTRTKNFITPDKLKSLKTIEGIEKIIPLYSVDFPMGVEFGVPGTPNRFRAEVIGIGIPPENAKPYIQTRSKNFSRRRGKVPVLVASYILQVFNVLLQNNDIPYKITEKNVIGLSFFITVGASAFQGASSDIKPQTIPCQVVGFVDMDYTYGIAFPASFVERFKRQYWRNFRPGYYDSLILEINLERFDRIQKQIEEKGFQVHQDTGIFQKISRFIRENKRGVGLFLNFISIVILILGLIIGFYTILWMLKGKNLEFSLYRFFGSSRIRILFLYGAYLSVLNVLSLIAAYFVLKEAFQRIGDRLLKLAEDLPAGFSSLLQKDFILGFQVLKPYFTYSFFFLEGVVLSLIALYLAGLNRKL